MQMTANEEADRLRDLLRRVVEEYLTDSYFAGEFNSDHQEEDRLRDEVRAALGLPPVPLRRMP